jgi:ribonuclease HII
MRPRTPEPEAVRIAGVDEAGRGPLAGPVVVAAVILREDANLPGLDDSKRVSAEHRERLYQQICSSALAWAIVAVEVEEIGRVNILAASLSGWQRSVLQLDPAPSLVMVDGNRAPELKYPVRTMVGGDRWVPAISAASILAKVTRDRMMLEWHERYPDYGFDQHKGYPTPAHLECLKRLGPCPIHRRTFAPVRALLAPGLF